MRKFLRAILRRSVAFILVFAVGVSVVMLRVYYLHDEELGSDPLDVSSVRREILVQWRTPYSFRVSIPPKGDLTDDRIFRYAHPLMLILPTILEELIDAINAAGAEPIELQIDARINLEDSVDRWPQVISHR